MILHLSLLTLLTAAVAALGRSDEGLSFFTGGILMTANLALLAFAWKNILAKKLIALSVGVIVIKYAILGIIIYSIVTFELMSVGWFAIGMGVLLISCVAYALSNEVLNRNKEALN